MSDTLIVIKSLLTVAVALAIFLYLTVSLYPRILLRPVWLGRRDPWITGDRGVRRVTFPGGRATVYEPTPQARRYLHRYALVKQNGCVLLRCRIHEQIAYLRYDVAAFDSRGRLLDVLGVRERITEAGHTRAVRLPRATAYACVTLRQVDGVYEDHTLLVGYSYLRMGLFTGICAATAALICGMVWESILEMANTPLIPQISDKGLAVPVAAVLGILYALLVLQLHYRYAKKVINT